MWKWDLLEKHLSIQFEPYTWDTNLIFMRYAVSFELRFRNDYSVSNQDAPTVCCVVHHHHDARLLAVHHAKRTGGGKRAKISPTALKIKWAINEKWSCTHKAMRPSEARLNTTFPRAATPALWPCVREERVRGSRLPTRPVGDRNWGEEQGPSADVWRLESIVLNLRAFTFPWGEAETRSGRQEIYMCFADTLWQKSVIF